VNTLIVEFLSDEFQFYKNEKPTGYYARGLVVKEYSDRGTILVECFSNGRRFEVKRNEVKEVTAQYDNNTK
jgi:hypothetical protein